MPITMEILNNIWSKLELRGMIMLSLFLQTILIAFGARRKSMKAKWIMILVWLSYLFADTVATFSIGLLLRHSGGEKVGGSLKDSSSSTRTMLLPMFWSPFLLLHHGGPDTITAYSKKDNELWLRHLVNLVVQIVAVFYSLLNYWNAKNVLSILTIPIFISGLMKYGERTWVLSSASAHPLAGPLEVSQVGIFSVSESGISHARGLCSAYGFVVKHLQWLVSFDVKYERYINPINENGPPGEAFKIVELELSLMFDLIYTKIRIIYSIFGVSLRFFTFLSTLSTLALFSIAIDKHDYSNVDVAITISLLVGAVALEMCAVFTIIFSDWTLLWLVSRNKSLCNSIYQAIWSSRFYLPHNKKRRSISMGQLKLGSYWPSRLKLLDFVGYNTPSRMCFNLRTSWLVTHADVTDDLRERLFKRLVDEKKEPRIRRGTETERDLGRTTEEIFPQRLRDICRRYEIPPDIIEEGYTDFEGVVLLWHVATHRLYHSDLMEEESTVEGGTEAEVTTAGRKKACDASILLADYMFYLLAACPFLLPKVFKGGVMLRDIILVGPSAYGSDIEERFRTLVQEGKMTEVQMWNDVVCEIWVSILIYAAAKCRWEEQVEQLGKGGELLTHVWLLMVHFNLTEEFKSAARSEAFFSSILI